MEIPHPHSTNGSFDSGLNNAGLNNAGLNNAEANHERSHTHALIPRGVADYFWDAARHRRALEDQLLSVFYSWGYGHVIPPTLEYADTFEARTNMGQTRAGQTHAGYQKPDIVRFMDHDGHALALRYDMTVAIARLVGTRLHDAPMPQRFCYVGNIFRHADPQAGQQREFGQAGVELIGADTVAADTEILALTARTLQEAGLKHFRITLGQLRFFRGLLEELDLTVAEQRALIQAVERRSEPELDHFLAQSSLSEAPKRAVRQLLTLSGKNSLALLDKAQKLCVNTAMEEAVENICEIYEALTAYDLGRFIHIDLTEVSDLGYYTGIRFMAYAPGLGFSIASGGRYDNLISAFGPAQPAVGVAFGIERILLALQSTETADLPILDSHVLVSGESAPSWVEVIESWRGAGIKVVVDVNGLRGQALADAARQTAITYALSWTATGFDVYDCSRASNSPPEFVPDSESLAYLSSKLNPSNQ